MFDKNIVLPAAVLIQSISDHYFLNYDLDIVCCVSGDSEQIFDEIQSLVNISSRINLKLVSINENNFPFIKDLEKAKTNHWAINPAAEMYKLFLGSLLEGYDKTIYIDCDVIAVNNIQPILEHPMTGKVMCVVDTTATEFSGPKLPAHRAYFNNGVVIADLNWWRDSNIEETFLNYIKETGFIAMGAEELYNLYLSAELHPLPFTFNFYQFTRDKDGIPNYDESVSLPTHYKSAILMHFGGGSKPWNFEKMTKKEDTSFLGKKWRKLASSLQASRDLQIPDIDQQ